MYEIEVRHRELNKFRIIRGKSRYEVEQKAKIQLREWNELWANKQSKENEKINKANKQKIALERSKNHAENLNLLNNILSSAVANKNLFDWNTLLDNSMFNIPLPNKPKLLTFFELIYLLIYPPNDNINYIYKPYFNFTEKLYNIYIKIFKSSRLNSLNLIITRDYSQLLNKYDKLLKDWENNKLKFESSQNKRNEDILKLKKLFYSKNLPAIKYYFDNVLNNSIYPEYFPKKWNLEILNETNILVVDYTLPNISDLPKIKSTKYIVSHDKLEDSLLSDAEINSIYDSIVYQISLRTIFEIYNADTINAISSIVFNGYVNGISGATGNPYNSCIVSIQANKSEFEKLNFSNIDPKACFKHLNGIGSSRLHSIVAVPPIIKINKDDNRFIDGYNVLDEYDNKTNLATMHWQDFENFIRDIFAKEFSLNGGEVKVTRASRDGGVDAIAFDPDPIKGGKIVIQAKRYTNTVGVSDVRDLYGTTMNEGAMKGILVTTANYSPDAYSFANGKPLTLINGSELLHLLEKHGHLAKIDLYEAKNM